MRLPISYLRRDRFGQVDTAFIAMTRFNLHGLSPDVAKLSPEDYVTWCEQRASVFREYCLPSMVIQIPRPHAWFILFDEDLVPPVANLIEELKEHSWIVPLMVPAQWQPALTKTVPVTIREWLGPSGATTVCCARLDSDDTIHPRYFAALDTALGQVHAEGEPGPAWAIDFPYGAARVGDDVFPLVIDRAFFALVEPLAICTTPYRRSHLSMDVPIITAFTQHPMWIYQRHGTNIGLFAAARQHRFAEPEAILAGFGLIPV